MKPITRYKQWLKEWRELLVKSPGHPRITEWIKQAEKDMKEWRKQRDDNTDFTKFYKVFLKTGNGNKDSAWGNWKTYVTKRDVDPEVVIAAVPHYFVWCKQTDTSMLNAEGYISGSRWEKFEQVREKVEQKRLCKICKVKTAVTQISYRANGINFGGMVCTNCKQYDGMEYKDGKWVNL